MVYGNNKGAIITMNNTCILVCSCDKYDDIWNVFFFFLKKYWPDCDYPIFLSTETKKYVDHTLNVTVLNDNKSKTWSKRIINALRRIKSKNVIIILDDFFILSNVDKDNLEGAINIINNHKEIACLSFLHTMKVIKTKKLGQFYCRNKKSTYIVNLLPGLWKRKALISLLSPYENAWQFEWFGTERARISNWEFYSLDNDSCSIIPFNISLTDGYGLCQGKWTKETRTLFKREGIDIDLTKRGFCNPSLINTFVDIPRFTFSYKINTLFYGGLPVEDADNEKIKLRIFDQIKILFSHPRYYLKVFMNKLRIIFDMDINKRIDTKTGDIVDGKD